MCHASEKSWICVDEEPLTRAEFLVAGPLEHRHLRGHAKAVEDEALKLDASVLGGRHRRLSVL